MIEQNEEHSNSRKLNAKKSWLLSLQFDLDSLGQLVAEVHLQELKVNVKLWSLIQKPPSWSKQIYQN